jgi:hypothetical protein
MTTARKSTIFLLLALVGAGWAWQAVSLREAGKFDLVPNFAAIGRSPYGKTLAMAVQGPVDVYWHKGREAHHDHDEHGLAGGEPCEESGCSEADDERGTSGLFAAAKSFVEQMEAAVVNPNTPYGHSRAHEKYLHRQIEKKLEVAYWLDPGNYANFNALVLFLSESALASRELDPEKVYYFAERTISFVESGERVNPEPWLTAASAVLAKMQWYEQLKGAMPDARERFAAEIPRIERHLSQYLFLRDLQMARGSWEGIPVARRVAMEARYGMLCKLLEAKKIILNTYFDPAS